MYYPIIFGIAIIAAFIGGRTVVSTIIGAFFGILIGFVCLPTLNIASGGFWAYLFIVLAISMAIGLTEENISNNKNNDAYNAMSIGVGCLFFISAIFIGIIGSPMFNSDDYVRVIGNIRKESPDDIQGIHSKDATDINLSDITLVTAGMAERRMHIILGSEKYQSYGRNYTIGDKERVIRNGRQTWVAPLEYSGAGIYAYLHNIASPGYLWVDANNDEDAGIVTSNNGKDIAMSYIHSGILSHNSIRIAREKYPTKLFDIEYFQTDDHGNPVNIITVYAPIVAWSGKKPDGIIVVNAQTGDSTYYATNAIPSWVTYATGASIAQNIIEDWGTYIHGYWNSTAFGNGTDIKEISGNIDTVPLTSCNMAFYLGIHPPNAKYGNEGFFLYNAQTLRASFIPVSGITEEQAESAIESRISNQRGWNTNTAILYRVYNVPTFLTTITDNNHNFRGVGLVSAEDSSINVFAPTLEEAVQQYGIALQRNTSGALSPNAKTVRGTGNILRIQENVSQGNSIFYLIIAPSDPHANNILAQMSAIPNPKLILAQAGDSITYKGTYDPSGQVLNLDTANVNIAALNTPKTK